MKKFALISVSDKTGIVDFAKGLEELGFKLISTGGTAATLLKAGIDCIEVSQLTGFPECLDGRVKTLHPKIHAGILAKRSDEEHLKQLEELEINTIDLVCINLYPFKETIKKEGVTLDEAIENIDIGGPTMLRAAAKNWQDVIVVTKHEDYGGILEELKKSGEISENTKFKLASSVFEHTAAYDTLISIYLRTHLDSEDTWPQNLNLTYEKVQDMRYGENPHQSAAFYAEVFAGQNTLPKAKQLQGKELSYNNINDANGALDLLKEFGDERPTVVAVKHANPCGVGQGENIFGAYKNAHDADPLSIFGGIIAANKEIDEKTALEMQKIFLEIIIAPSFTEEALKVLGTKKNLRLLEMPHLTSKNSEDSLDFKKVAGGLLVQRLDTELYKPQDLICVTKRQPSESELDQLFFAWRVVKHVKSNAICLVKGDRTVGIGPGQTNRVTALEIAINYAKEEAGGSVMGSDAFFPYPDSVELAAKVGIRAIIQPGGSIKDDESIKAADEAGIAMLFTSMRHFKH
ncbi:MAG: bifunctional phosphoribosylaminoimidazolecarboxamide formyltransferase/IMP cyclohydrolase [Clostridiales bacterium]|nr:bifunctional phosphoribosylaminoimidazolecarboxamide formyltransferase/IMP cyclohydrolase [Clostridiales bacterium]